MMAMQMARTLRGRDWPPELHAAYDEVERTGDRMLNAATAFDLEMTQAVHFAARDKAGALLLELDKRRRPHAYRSGSSSFGHENGTT